MLELLMSVKGSVASTSTSGFCGYSGKVQRVAHCHPQSDHCICRQQQLKITFVHRTSLVAWCSAQFTRGVHICAHVCQCGGCHYTLILLCFITFLGPTVLVTGLWEVVGITERYPARLTDLVLGLLHVNRTYSVDGSHHQQYANTGKVITYTYNLTEILKRW